VTERMDDSEIVIDYRRAKNKQKQIRILAELNTCSEDRIKQILTEHGEELPTDGRRKPMSPETKRKISEAQARAHAAKRAAGLEPPKAAPAPERPKEPKEPKPSAARAPEPPVPARAAPGGSLTVGSLIDILSTVPYDTVLQVSGSGPVQTVLLTRRYEAGFTEEVVELLLEGAR